jgi:UDP-N-acetylglucosamine--N-acetylmuramyl-(pentapeptide) pyrophosphoryl-undecaprenol N-acetylglucosamine transferase
VRPSRLFVFAGGGTGGHLFPAIAVAEALAEQDPSAEPRFLCTDRPIDASILTERGLPFVPQTVRPLPKNPLAVPGFLRAWRAACRFVRRQFRERPPAVVVSSGGYGAGPALAEAVRASIPLALLNPDAVPGRANRRYSGRAAAIFAQWRVTSRSLGGEAPIEVTGCPVRREFSAARRVDGLRTFELDPSRRTLVVTGASQGAQTVNRAVAALLPRLVEQKEWQIVHLAGAADAADLQQRYRAHSLHASVLDFTTEMPALLAAADLVVSRAGASTLAELTVVGAPSILMPYPFHRDRHQTLNARQLADVGAAVIVDDRIEPDLNAPKLADALLPLLSSPDRLADMRHAALQLARPDAAKAVARRLIELADDPKRAGNSLKRSAAGGR